MLLPRVKKDASAAFADSGIQAAINKTDEENRYNTSFILPETVNGEKYIYISKDNTWVRHCHGGIGAGCTNCIL